MIKLAGYKIIEKIGSGGMGAVYLAEHEKLEKKVAIKSLHKNLAINNDFRSRFLKEAKTHSMLGHANIVSLLDYKERKDGLFLIMEYVEGMQLDNYIKNVTGPIPERELIKLFHQILDAIGYAHEKGLIHRDIKPSNIMISNDGIVKILDFGIAKLQDDDKELTKTGVQVGTAAYMSPEQVNAKKLDKLTDIYSLGVTLYYMAVGKSPYTDDTNTFSIQTKIVGEPLPIASKVYPGVSKIIEDIIIKATEKNKSERYQSCKEFKKSLDFSQDYVKLNSKKTPFIFRVLFFFSVILASYFAYKANDFHNEISIINSEVFNLNSEISKLESQTLLLEEDLSGINYDSGCTDRSKLYFQNKSWRTDLKLYISWKKNDGSWSEWSFWAVDDRKRYYLTSQSSTLYANDYRYYVATNSNQNYLCSRYAPGLTSTCITPTLFIY